MNFNIQLKAQSTLEGDGLTCTLLGWVVRMSMSRCWRKSTSKYSRIIYSRLSSHKTSSKLQPKLECDNHAETSITFRVPTKARVLVLPHDVGVVELS